MAKKKAKRGRPPKDPQHRKGRDLRIPVTDTEKATIDEAVALTEKGEMADWARGILLAAARKLIQKNT